MTNVTLGVVDPAILNRANHTGEVPMEDITGLDAALSELEEDISAVSVQNVWLEAIATTSETYKEITGIPDDVSEITIDLFGVSVNGADHIAIWIGDSGGIETSGYAGAAGVFAHNSALSIVANSSSFRFGSGADANVYSGMVTLRRINAAGTEWMCDGKVGFHNTTAFAMVNGSKTLSAALDRVRIGSSAGTATFDAGKIRVSYIREAPPEA